MPKLISHLEPITIFQIEGEESLTKRRLADAGERLMGTHGIDAPTLQDIADRAGQANKFAIQYHFGGRDGLIDAIFAIRMRRIEDRRTQLLERARQIGLADDLDSLLEAVFIPMSEQVDESGHHTYARFLMQYTSRIGFDANRVDDPFNSRRTLVISMMQKMSQIVALDYQDFEISFYQQHFAMNLGLAARDNLSFRGERDISLEKLIDQTVVMVAAALRASADFARKAALPRCAPSESCAR